MQGPWTTAFGVWQRSQSTHLGSHPAAVLRAQLEARSGLYRLLVDDLRRVAKRSEEQGGSRDRTIQEGIENILQSNKNLCEGRGCKVASSQE